MVDSPKEEHKKRTFKAWWIPEQRRRGYGKRIKQPKDCTSITLRFITKQEQYAVPQVPVAVNDNSGPAVLNNLIYAFLSRGCIENIPTFEFMVEGKLLISSVGWHLKKLGIGHEVTTEIEYFERYPPPTPKDNLEHDDWVSSVMSCGNWLVTGCYDNTVQLWSVNNIQKGFGKRAHKLTIPAHKAPVKAVAWINATEPIKSFVSCSIDQTAMVWDWDSRNNSVECVWECRGHSQSVECLGVEPKGSRFATGSWDNMIKIWDGDSESRAGLSENEEEPGTKRMKKHKRERLKTPIMTLGGHSENVSGVGWFDSSKLLSCSWDHSVRLWDLQIGGMASQLVGNVAFFCLSYSQLNKTLLAGCADRHVRLYDPRSSEGSVVKDKFINHTKWVSSVRWSGTDENLFVSGSYDNTVRVWDRRSSKASLYNFTGHDEKVLSVDWSYPNHVASGSADCTAQVYDAK